ncbi:cuticle protein 18.6-like [Phlebotomus papatasi]|uniref:cuticle protein 18.6-like n=1 Tax=Phlebotomus papatasi TaxID=29031 RepID=UPI0024845EFC|nr:cuticle protein 18.6-like [Phlebotomus papatasi]
MVFKFVPVLALLAVAHARPGLQQIYQAPALLKSPAAIIQPAPLLAQPALLARKEIESYDPNPQYAFNYNIQDALTGDFKSQQESLENGVIKGQYSLLEADGRQRIVDYIADPINGFNADVKYAGAAKPALAIAPAQPALIKTVAAPAPAAIIKASPAPAIYRAAPALAAPALIKAAPAFAAPALAAYPQAYASAYAPALAPAYAPALAPAYAPALARAAYATSLPYASTQYVKY